MRQSVLKKALNYSPSPARATLGVIPMHTTGSKKLLQEPDLLNVGRYTQKD